MTNKSNQDEKKTPRVAKTRAVKKKVAKKTAAKKTSAKKPSTVKTNAPVKDRRVQPTTGRRSEDKVMPGLLQNLQGAFDKLYNDNRDQDKARDLLAKEMNGHLQATFKTMHEQLEERENLLDRKLKNIDRMHSHQIQRVKLMSVPVMLLSLVAIVYLFYVVRVMEVAMSSMSENMEQMTAYMETITDDTHALSLNTQDMVTKVGEMNTQITRMNSSFTQMNTNVNNMRADVHHMTRTVSPAMNGISRFMP